MLGPRPNLPDVQMIWCSQKQPGAWVNKLNVRRSLLGASGQIEGRVQSAHCVILSCDNCSSDKSVWGYDDCREK